MKKYTIRELRIKSNLTQAEVAEKSGVTETYISLLENGNRNPSDKLKKQLAEIYGCSVPEIFLALQLTQS